MSSPGSRTAHQRKTLSGVLIIAAASLAFAAIGSPQAEALSGNCSAYISNGTGYTVGKGSCKTLGRDTKARVHLDVRLGPDRYSSWFTRTGVTYSTSHWYNDPSNPTNGYPRSARIDQDLR